MTAPVFQREGCRAGGLTDSTVAVTSRTNSDGVNFWIELSKFEDFRYIEQSTTSVSLTSDNNYQNTTYAENLDPNTEYWYRCVADDGLGNETRGTKEGYTIGRFRTMPSSLEQASKPFKLVFMSCDISHPGVVGEPGSVIASSAYKFMSMWQGIYSLRGDMGINMGDVYYSDSFSNQRNFDSSILPNWVSGSNYERYERVESVSSPGSYYEANDNLTNSTTDPASDSGNWTLITEDDGFPFYSEGAWRCWNYNDYPNADAGSYRTNFISCFSEHSRLGWVNYHALSFIDMPVCFMWDDHCSSWNDADGFHVYEPGGYWETNYGTYEAEGRYSKYQIGTEVADECFMDLNATHINKEDGRTYQHGVNPAAKYYYVDYPGTRLCVVDTRTYRDVQTSTDTISKTMLGTEQKQWLKDRIDDNPHRNLIIATPMMFDGNHGWDESPSETWKSYSWERDEIFDYIRTNGNPATTILVEGDTHTGAVARYDDFRETEGPLDAYLAGNLWPVSYHDYINGWGEGASKLSGDRPRGGRLLTMRVDKPCVVTIDLNTDGTMTAGLYEPVTNTMVMKKTY